MKQIGNLFHILLLGTTACHGSNAIKRNALTDTGKIMQLTPPKPDVTLTLPDRIYSNVFADGLGKARHITVTLRRIYLCETG